MLVIISEKLKLATVLEKIYFLGATHTALPKHQEVTEKPVKHFWISEKFRQGEYSLCLQTVSVSVPHRNSCNAQRPICARWGAEREMPGQNNINYRLYTTRCSMVARFGLFEGKKWQICPFFIGWPGHSLEFIKYLAFFKVYRRFYSKIKPFFFFKTDFGIFR